MSLTRGILRALRAGRDGFRALCGSRLSLGSGVHAVTRRVCNTRSIMCRPTTRGRLTGVRSVKFNSFPVYVTGGRCSLSSSTAGLKEPRGFSVRVHRMCMDTKTNFIITLAKTIVAVPKLPGIPTTGKVSIASSKGVAKLFWDFLQLTTNRDDL